MRGNIQHKTLTAQAPFRGFRCPGVVHGPAFGAKTAPEADLGPRFGTFSVRPAGSADTGRAVSLKLV